MQKNIGKKDKIIRAVLGALVLLWGFYAKNWWGVIGIILLVTSLVNWCPLYTIFKFSTNGERLSDSTSEPNA
jgi:hypothetical protein